MERIALLNRLLSVYAHYEVLAPLRMRHRIATSRSAFRQGIGIAIPVHWTLNILGEVAFSSVCVPVHSRDAAHFNRLGVIAQIVPTSEEQGN